MVFTQTHIDHFQQYYNTVSIVNTEARSDIPRLYYLHPGHFFIISTHSRADPLFEASFPARGGFCYLPLGVMNETVARSRLLFITSVPSPMHTTRATSSSHYGNSLPDVIFGSFQRFFQRPELYSRSFQRNQLDFVSRQLFLSTLRMLPEFLWMCLLEVWLSFHFLFKAIIEPNDKYGSRSDHPVCSSVRNMRLWTIFSTKRAFYRTRKRHSSESDLSSQTFFALVFFDFFFGMPI